MGLSCPPVAAQVSLGFESIGRRECVVCVGMQVAGV